VTAFYDPMIAKLIVHAPTRHAVAARMATACAGVEVWPVRTNAAFLARAARHPDFVAGRIDTGFIERHAEQLIPGAEPSPAVIAAAAAALVADGCGDPWDTLTGFRIAASADRRVAVDIAGATRLVEIDPAGVVADVAGERVLFLAGEAWSFAPPDAGRALGSDGAADGAILSPMPGRIVAVEVVEGERVVKGQKLVVLEAMKMEHALTAPFDGVVEALTAVAGDQVAEGLALARISKDG